MDGITIPVDKTLNVSVGSMRSTTNFFRPMFMKRSVSDLVNVPRKKHVRNNESEARQSARGAGNQVPVVSVQYDVPKTPPSPLMYRIRRLNTPQSSYMSGRSKSEDKLNQIAVNVESHRLKGLGVGKCYSDYHTSPTAHGLQRSNTTIIPESNRTNPTVTPSASLVTNSSAQSSGRSLQRAVSNASSASSTQSRQPSNLDHAMMKSSQSMHITQINNAYMQRQKTKTTPYNDSSTEEPSPQKSVHPQKPVKLIPNGYRILQTPVLFSDSCSPYRADGEGFANKVTSSENLNQQYAAYQNVKHLSNRQDEYHKDLTHTQRQQGTITAASPSPRDPVQLSTVKSLDNFTLRELLLQKSRERKHREEDDDSGVKLPRLNVVRIGQDNKNGSNGGNGPQGSSNSNTALLNMNQRLNQMKAQKDLTSVQMYSQRMVRLRMTQNQRRQILPWFGSTVVLPQGLGYNYRVRSSSFVDGVGSRSVVMPVEQELLALGSSSTPTVPYSTADILYGNEVSGGGTRSQPGDELRQNGFGDLERNKDSRRTKDLENPNNRRPSSKSSKQKSISIDSVTLDKERDDPLKGLSAALPPTKPSHHLRTNGIKSRQGESLFSPKQNGAATGREQDDLVAMGTYWSPNSGGNPQERTSGPVPGPSSSGTLPSQDGGRLRGTGSMANTNTNSYSSKVASSTSVNNTSSSNNTLNTQRKYPSSSMRPIVVQNNVSGKKNTNSREQEDPKYTDPMIGAPASFQQRIIELGALEGDTVRWERSKRLKKKKADRDS